MKKIAKRKLVLGREVVVALRTELHDARMRDVRGGRSIVMNSNVVMIRDVEVCVCSGGCQTIEQSVGG